MMVMMVLVNEIGVCGSSDREGGGFGDDSDGGDDGGYDSDGDGGGRDSGGHDSGAHGGLSCPSSDSNYNHDFACQSHYPVTIRINRGPVKIPQEQSNGLKWSISEKSLVPGGPKQASHTLCTGTYHVNQILLQVLLLALSLSLPKNIMKFPWNAKCSLRVLMPSSH